MRFIRQADSKPLVDILSVAILAGVSRELLRLRQAPSVDRATRRLGWLLGLAAFACWAGAVWLERNASDHGAWIIVCGIVVVVTLAVLDRIRNPVANPRIGRTGSGGAGAAGARGTAIRWMTLPALRATIAFVAFELIVVDWIGSLAAHRLGFDEGYLFPLTILICGSAGFVARRLGSSGAVAGAAVTGTEGLVWALTGGLTPVVGQLSVKVAAGIVVTVVGLGGGGAVGFVCGWLGAR